MGLVSFNFGERFIEEGKEKRARRTSVETEPRFNSSSFSSGEEMRDEIKLAPAVRPEEALLYRYAFDM